MATNDLQASASVAEGLETTARLISRYTIFEAVYLPAVGEKLTPAQSKLCDALVLLYSGCLRFLADIETYYERSTGERIARSLYELSDRVIHPLKNVTVKEEEVEKLGQIVQTERAYQLDASSSDLQDKSRASFESAGALLRFLKGPLLCLSNPLVLFRDSLELDDPRVTITDSTMSLLTEMLFQTLRNGFSPKHSIVSGSF